MFRRKTEGCLVHGIARTKSQKDSFWKLIGEGCQGLGYNGRVASDHVCHRDSDSNSPGPRSYRGESCEGFWRGRVWGPVEQMVVDQNCVEALFFAKLCSLDNILEGLVGR